GGWIYNSLPYLGLNMIHDCGKGLTGAAKTSAMAEAQTAVIPLLNCATRRRAIALPCVPNQDQQAYNSATPPIVGKTDYAANLGSNFIAGQGPARGCDASFPDCKTWNVEYTPIPSGMSNGSLTTANVGSIMEGAGGAPFNGISGIMTQVTP